MHPYWMGRSINPSNIKTHVAVNIENHKKYLEEYLGSLYGHKSRVISVTTDRIGVCYPSYQLSSTLEGKEGDIVVFASDDFLPPVHWDDYLTKTLEGKEGGLMVRDGYQLPDSSNMQYPAITIPIMTWGCFEKLNKTIYNPVYTHMYSDCELYLNLRDTGMLIDNRIKDLTVFEHLHHAAGKRQADQLDVQYHLKWKDDEITWNKRRIMNVKDRL